MEYSDASGLFLPVRGTKAPGKSIVIAGDGIPEWTDVATQAELDAAVLGGGGSSDFGRITETVLGSAQATIPFSSIAATYRHLKIIITGRGDTAVNNFCRVRLRLNSDSGANYDF